MVVGILLLDRMESLINYFCKLAENLEKKDKIKIIRFEDMSFNVKNELYDSISDRANSCEHQCEIDFFKEKFKNVQTIQNYLRLKNDED